MLDLAVAGVALGFLAPALGLIAVVVGLDAAGPLLTGRRCVGRAGRTFDLLRFRTMAGRGPTPVGRFLRVSGLDEVPALLNVLRGDMSLVGPRPRADAAPALAYVRPGLICVSDTLLRDGPGERQAAADRYAAEGSFRDDLLILGRGVARQMRGPASD